MAHVLDAAREDHVACAECDLTGARRHGGQRTGTHPIECEARDRLWEAREQGDVATQRQALVADLRRRGEDDVADALRRKLGLAAKQLSDDLDGHVLSTRLPE